jgi:hypothetical protein
MPGVLRFRVNGFIIALMPEFTLIKGEVNLLCKAWQTALQTELGQNGILQRL